MEEEECNSLIGTEWNILTDIFRIISISMLRSQQNDRHSGDDIFKCNFLKKYVSFSQCFIKVCSSGFIWQYISVKSGNGVTDPLWGESTSHRWISSHKGIAMQSLGVSFVVSLNMLLNKQLICQWWRSCDTTVMVPQETHLISSADGLLPDSTKLLPEPMLTSRNEILGHLADSNFASIVKGSTLCNEFENCTFILTATSLRGQ